MASTGRHGGGGGGGGRGGRGGRGRGGRGGWRGGRVFAGGPSFYGYGYPYGGYGYYYAAQQQAYLQYLQQLAAAYAQPQYAAMPGASMQIAQLRASIDRLTQELAGIENSLRAR